MPKLNGTMDGGKGLNVGKSRPGSNRNVSVSVPSLRPPLDTRRPVVIPKLVPVSGVWPTFAAFLPRRSALPPFGLCFPERRILLGSFGAGEGVACQRVSLQRSLARLVH
jgi:hypothetical protein